MGGKQNDTEEVKKVFGNHFDAVGDRTFGIGDPRIYRTESNRTGRGFRIVDRAQLFVRDADRTYQPDVKCSAFGFGIFFSWAMVFLEDVDFGRILYGVL